MAENVGTHVQHPDGAATDLWVDGVFERDTGQWASMSRWVTASEYEEWRTLTSTAGSATEPAVAEGPRPPDLLPGNEVDAQEVIEPPSGLWRLGRLALQYKQQILAAAAIQTQWRRRRDFQLKIHPAEVCGVSPLVWVPPLDLWLVWKSRAARRVQRAWRRHGAASPDGRATRATPPLARAQWAHGKIRAAWRRRPARPPERYAETRNTFKIADWLAKRLASDQG